MTLFRVEQRGIVSVRPTDDVNRVMAYPRVRRALDETLRIHPGTYGHEVEVAHFAAVTTALAGLADSRRKLTIEAALLHDKGKDEVEIRAPGLLDTKGRLSPEQFEVVKTHPEWGAARLKGSHPELVVLTAGNHHRKRQEAEKCYPGGGFDINKTDDPLLPSSEADRRELALILDYVTASDMYSSTWLGGNRNHYLPIEGLSPEEIAIKQMQKWEEVDGDYAGDTQIRDLTKQIIAMTYDPENTRGVIKPPLNFSRN